SAHDASLALLSSSERCWASPERSSPASSPTAPVSGAKSDFSLFSLSGGKARHVARAFPPPVPCLTFPPVPLSGASLIQWETDTRIHTIGGVRPGTVLQ